MPHRREASTYDIDHALLKANGFMRRKIEKRLHHGTWKGLSPKVILEKMMAEAVELLEEVERGGDLTRDEVLDEVVDVMNYGMMYIDEARGYGFVGARIKDMREARGITQRDLATATGITQATISRIEKGKVQNPEAEILHKIAMAFGMTLEDLIGWHHLKKRAGSHNAT